MPELVQESQPASEESGKAAEIVLVSELVAPAAEPVDSVGRVAPDASLPTTTDSATSQSSSPCYTGSRPRSCTSAVTGSVGPWVVAGGAARQRRPAVEQEASATAKFVECSR